MKKWAGSKVIDSIATCMLKFVKCKLSRTLVSSYFVALLTEINCILS